MKKTIWTWGMIPILISAVISISILGWTWFQYHEMTDEFRTGSDGSIWVKAISAEADENNQIWALLKEKE